LKRSKETTAIMSWVGIFSSMNPAARVPGRGNYAIEWCPTSSKDVYGFGTIPKSLKEKRIQDQKDAKKDAAKAEAKEEKRKNQQK